MLTEKQFKKALGCTNLKDEKWADFLKKHPIEYTDEWLYEFAKYKEGDFHCGGHAPGCGATHGGLDKTSEGYYGVAMYDQGE